MGRTNKHWRGWGNEFARAFFGPSKRQTKSRDYVLEKMTRQALRKQRRANDKAKRFAKRCGY